MQNMRSHQFVFRHVIHTSQRIARTSLHNHKTENPLLPQDQQMPQLQEDNLHYFKHTPIFFRINGQFINALNNIQKIQERNNLKNDKQIILSAFHL
jgi:hypothetical protein